ncbi:hypothetical protein EN817_31045, partial [Mesorhizobium sp. M3A.F.Ca.ET.174.01.1.1]|uniref:iron chelate uptake ABC transporter family permease subunit n=1 Tax=Mesorhizobium sp. M3A.F.Ca.ET.174.01.1.1 TaxID=2563944 RepID=UPI001093D26C
MSPKLETPLLDKVRIPADLRMLDESALPQLAAELRAELIDAVSQTGGHLGAGLGVVGALLQTVTRNDLADPFLFGLSS